MHPILLALNFHLYNLLHRFSGFCFSFRSSIMSQQGTGDVDADKTEGSMGGDGPKNEFGLVTHFPHAHRGPDYHYNDMSEPQPHGPQQQPIHMDMNDRDIDRRIAVDVADSRRSDWSPEKRRQSACRASELYKSISGTGLEIARDGRVVAGNDEEGPGED
ncbi:hypothetical protein BCR43DRAFT_70668 [Syncephalastrum racemosum]|uniref:Uncharacterized protein n=1 Tax=Syncephalastrum racemosum TaxID=13706 RepID=A0A1X2HWX6_SYNRA|nr:hypothetical protein BCR43DRAFT_70668 [Syncephalastrum racemosum]